MPQANWSRDDLTQLRDRQLPPATADHQLGMLHDGGRAAHLVRPCTSGDGIHRLSPARRSDLAARQRQAADEGRFSRFVPASGAASRMFGSLLHFARGAGASMSWNEIATAAETGDKPAAEMIQALTEAERFPFRDELNASLEPVGGLAAVIARNDHRALLTALLEPDGMDCASRPKGLLPFHQYPEGPRTPVEEHLTEAAGYSTSANAVCELHFTVSSAHHQAFRDLLERRQSGLEEAAGCRFNIHFSAQGHHTDTLAIDAAGRPLRDQRGRLRFRPGGHGALLENLAQQRGDLVYVKNIDNMQPAWRRQATLEWKTVLGGLLAELQETAHALVRGLRQENVTPQLLADAASFSCELLGLAEASEDGQQPDGGRRRNLLRRLDRPLRVCGVVPNTGEPGGGPFWVRDADGEVRPQIVESAQVDASDSEQLRIFGQATHFNPVDLVCGLRDADGSPYDLAQFVDPEAAIVTTKSVHGEKVRVLELPGLWNGSMAGWNTVFVEVPIATFSPVKSVLDLLRPEHQPF